MEPINKQHSCPECQANWQGDDIFNHLTKMDLYVNKTPREMEVIAGYYGWTPENKLTFSLLKKIEIPELAGGMTFYQCPNEKCLKVFESKTSEMYPSLRDAIIAFKNIEYINSNNINVTGLTGEEPEGDFNG